MSTFRASSKRSLAHRRGLYASICLLSSLFYGATFADPGSLDPAFTPASLRLSQEVFALAVQSDGKILMGGIFRQVNGIDRNGVARLNPNGTLDATFNPGAGNCMAIAIRSDGRILVGGDFQAIASTARNRIGQILPDGSLDASFDPGSGADGQVFAIAVQADGSILAGGQFKNFDGTSRTGIARLTSGGTVDPSYNPSIGSGLVVRAIALQPNGQALLAGTVRDQTGQFQGVVARLNTDGSSDESFRIMTELGSDVSRIALQSDGKALVGGNFSTLNEMAFPSLARLNVDGSFDFTFVSEILGIARVTSIAPIEDGKMLIGGIFGAEFKPILRLEHDGNIDPSFDLNRIVDERAQVTSIAFQPDGQILAVGGFPRPNDVPPFGQLIRLMGDYVELQAELREGVLLISWPAGSNGFSLEGASTLADPWEAISDSPTISGDRMLLTLQSHDDLRFFRLKK